MTVRRELLEQPPPLCPRIRALREPACPYEFADTAVGVGQALRPVRGKKPSVGGAAHIAMVERFNFGERQRLVAGIDEPTRLVHDPPVARQDEPGERRGDAGEVLSALLQELEAEYDNKH